MLLTPIMIFLFLNDLIIMSLDTSIIYNHYNDKYENISLIWISLCSTLAFYILTVIWLSFSIRWEYQRYFSGVTILFWCISMFLRIPILYEIYKIHFGESCRCYYY